MKTLQKHEIYKHVCFLDQPEKHLSELINDTSNMQLKANAEFVKNNTKISNICTYCENIIIPDTFDYYAGYWTPNIWFPVHSDCKKQAKERESIWSQSVDADCNDCLHFERGKVLAVGTWEGFCDDKKITVKAHSNTCTNNDCFKHRKL